MKAGQRLGLTGKELRNYFDTEREKLKAELALNRQARRLGVDVALLKSSSKSEEEIVSEWKTKRDEEEREALREYEKRKEAEERQIAALKQQIAVLESRLHPVTSDRVSENMTVSIPSHMSDTLVPRSREPEIKKKTVCDVKESQEPGKESLVGNYVLSFHEASRLPLTSTPNAGNTDLVEAHRGCKSDSVKHCGGEAEQCALYGRQCTKCETRDERPRGSQAGKPRHTPTAVQYNSKEVKSFHTEFSRTSRAVVPVQHNVLRKKRRYRRGKTQMSVHGRNNNLPKLRVRSRLCSHLNEQCFEKFRWKAARRPLHRAPLTRRHSWLHFNVRIFNRPRKLYDGGRCSAQRAAVVEKSSVRNWRKRKKCRPELRGNHQKRKRHAVPNFQERRASLVSSKCGAKRCSRRRRHRYSRVFHSRGACCPKRKRHRFTFRSTCGSPEYSRVS